MITTAQLKELVVKTFDLEADSASISDDHGLIGGGIGLDSVDALEIVLQLEKQFGIKIPNNEIKMEAFRTIQSLADFANQKAIQSAAIASSSV